MSRLVRAGVAAVLGALLVGCSDDPRPKMASSPSASPTVSEAPSTDPTPSQAPDVLGPEETVRAWVEARNETVQGGSSDAVYALSSRDCTTCRDSIEPVTDVYEAGGRFETTGWTVVRTRLVDGSGRAAKVSTALIYESGRTFPTGGASPITYVDQRRIATFELRRDANTWAVSFIGYLS